MNKKILKDILIYAAIALFFLGLSYAFVPGILEGKVVNQSDISGWKGMARETVAWNSAHPDDKALWTDSMFGGMPTVTMFDDFSGDITKPIYKALLLGTRPASYLFIALIGAFLLMLSMGINRFISVIGAVAVAFCSYNFQIIQVGHNTKMQAIAFAPWVMAAFIFTYRQALKDMPAPTPSCSKCKFVSWLGKHKNLLVILLGSVLFGLALSMQIKANHVQITYYLAIILLVYAISTLVWVLLKRNRSKFGKFVTASVCLLVMGLAGIGTNANKLIPTAAYAPFTMRGGSELTGNKDINSEGLSLDYATQWSYGIGETPNLLIPNFNGGSSSGALDEDSATWKIIRQYGGNARQVCQALPLYWGPQPFTAGPMYMGAISIFLFILGLFLFKGREKWWLLVCVILAILLSWGNHFMWFTKIWFDLAPMYNKFRTVSMALVILQFCIPLLGVVVLDRIVKQEIPSRKVVMGLWLSFGITAGFCLFVSIFPSIAGAFTSENDSQMQDLLVSALREDRRMLLVSDAIRSMMLVTISASAIMFAYYTKDGAKSSKRLKAAAGIIAVLVLFDMWSAGKRYLNDGDLVTAKDFDSQLNERPADKYILEDKDPSYRVLDLSENTFNSSLTSYRHKSIGGYSPTKMQRYQDLIDHNLMQEMQSFYNVTDGVKTLDELQNKLPYMPVMSMLNARYVIIGSQYPPIVNHYAFGPAWLAGGFIAAADADGELASMKTADLHTDVVVRPDKFPALAADFEKLTVKPTPARDSAASSIMTQDVTGDKIELVSYTPNELHYKYACSTDRIAVFSEIYHPSWTAVLNGKTADGAAVEAQPLDLFQADWVLRGALLPAGEGEITMRYTPADYAQGLAISKASSSVLLLILALVVLGSIFSLTAKKENA